MQRNKAEDISNRTVLTVLVVIILVSIVSLAIYLSALDKAVPVIVAGDTGEVSLSIDTPSQGKPLVTSDDEQSKVALAIDSPNTTSN